MSGKLGILAGGGALPRRIIEACRAQDRDVFVIAVEGHADAETVHDVDHAWVRLGAAGTADRLCRERGIRDIVLAGRIRRPSWTELWPDARTLRFLAKVGRRALGDDGLLRAVIREIEDEGYRIIGIETILGDALVLPGPLGLHRPDGQADADIARGIAVLSALSAVDVGQAVVVQQGMVLGVEAIEGTDALIERCGILRRDGDGGVLVKMLKHGQETRVDRPTVGPDTVDRACAAGLRGIAIQANGVILVDREEVVRRADAAGLFLLVIEA